LRFFWRCLLRSDLRPIIKRTDRSGVGLVSATAMSPGSDQQNASTLTFGIAKNFTQYLKLTHSEETWNLSNLAIAVKSILGVKSVGNLPWDTTRSELKASRSQPKSAKKYCEQPAKITVVAVGRRSKTSYKFSHTINQKNATR